MRREDHGRGRVLPGVSGLLILACGWTGCQALPSSTIGNGSVQRLPTVRILDQPYNLLDSPVYPVPATSHVLRWKAHHFEWDVVFYRDLDSYASIRFKQPVDLRPYRPKSYLRFRLNPDTQATNLYMGLVDRRPNGASPVMVRMPLAGHRVWRWNSEGFYAVPLRDFAAEGPVLSRDEKSTATEKRGRMDWGRIGEVRIGMLAGPRSARKFQVSFLQVGPAWQISEQ